MNLEQITSWRNWIGRAGAMFCFIFFIAAVDGLILRFTEPQTLLRLLPGESTNINGGLREHVPSIGDLTYVSSSDSIQVTFEELHSGFWLGGYMWRGSLTLSSDIQPGEYSLAIIAPGDQPQKPSTVFQVKVYRDHEGYREDSKSLFTRYMDISPWWVFGVFLPATCLAFALVFFVSHKRDRILAQEGKAEIYQITRGDADYEIGFGLGTENGVQPDSRLVLLDESGVPVGSVKVLEVSETDSTGLVGLEYEVKPGYLVSLHR